MEQVTSCSGNANCKIPNIEIAKPSGILTINGTLAVAKNFTYTSGAVDFNSVISGASTVVFTTPSGGTITSVAALNFQNVSFTHDSSSKTLSGTLTVNGALTFDVTFVSISGGTIIAKGDVTATKMTSTNSSMILQIAGGNDQTILGTTNCVIPNLEINKSGGTATFTGGIGVAKNFTYTSGTADFNNMSLGRSTVRFTGANTAGTINPGNKINVEGNLTVTKTGNSSANVGNTEIVLTGTQTQTLSHNTAYKFPGKKFTINKSGGDVSLLSNVSLSTSQNLDITSSANVNLNGYSLDGNGNFNCYSGTVNKGAVGVLWTSGVTVVNTCTVN